MFSGPRQRSHSTGGIPRVQSAGRTVESLWPRDTLMHQDYPNANEHSEAGRNVTRQDQTQKKILYENPSFISSLGSHSHDAEPSRYVASPEILARGVLPESRLESAATHNTAMSMLNAAPRLESPYSLLSTPAERNIAPRPSADQIPLLYERRAQG